MRSFDLVRDEDVTGISGTGRVAEGVVFTDGSAVLRWLTAHRSTTVFPSLETLETIHGHGGKTRVAFHDQRELVEIPKPHLHMGNEGEYADGSKYDQCGAGPADLTAHLAYDRLGKIEAPHGWTGWACWFVGGEVSLSLTSPRVNERAEDYVFENQKRTRILWDEQQVKLMVTREGVRQVDVREHPGRFVAEVRVQGVAYLGCWHSVETSRPAAE